LDYRRITETDSRSLAKESLIHQEVDRQLEQLRIQLFLQALQAAPVNVEYRKSCTANLLHGMLHSLRPWEFTEPAQECDPANMDQEQLEQYYQKTIDSARRTREVKARSGGSD
jgi:hypothetical protein